MLSLFVIIRHTDLLNAKRKFESVEIDGVCAVKVSF